MSSASAYREIACLWNSISGSDGEPNASEKGKTAFDIYIHVNMSVASPNIGSTAAYAGLVTLLPLVLLAAGLYYGVFAKTDIAAVLAGIATIEIAALTLWYALTTNRQLAVMQEQLLEMQKAREFAAQPLPRVALHEFRIEKPKLFAPYGRSEVVLQSRYFARFSVLNHGGHAAVNIDVTFTLMSRGKNEATVGWKASNIYDALTERGRIPESESEHESVMFADDTSGLLLDSLRRLDPAGGRNFPLLWVDIACRNVTGACFLVRQGYYMFRQEGSDSETLANWQLTIEGFAVKYARDIAVKDEMSRRGDRSGMNKWFDEMQSRVNKTLEGSDEGMRLTVNQAQQYFSVKAITEAEYTQFVSTHNYGGAIPSWLDSCMVRPPDNGNGEPAG